MKSFAFICLCLAFCAIPNVSAAGSLKVRNEGGYVAKFTVSYDLNGQQKSEGSGDFTAGVTKEIAVPDGATNIYLKVEEYWFIASLTTIFSKVFSSPEQKCYKIWGTTLAPSYGETGC